MSGTTVAEALVRTLEKLGVKLIFGLPGSQTCPIYDAFYSSKIRHVLVRHEQAAAYMADAYGKLTGELEAALEEGSKTVKNGQPTVIDIHIDGKEWLPS